MFLFGWFKDSLVYLFDMLCAGLQKSKFLQFVSKMRRGELIEENNQVKPNEAEWANEFASTQQANVNDQWAAEFTAGEVCSDSSNSKLFYLEINRHSNSASAHLKCKEHCDVYTACSSW